MISFEAYANEAVFLARCKQELAAIRSEQMSERERLERIFVERERECRAATPFGVMRK